jgi:hypothetical protein
MASSSVASWLWDRGISCGDVVMITGATMDDTLRTIQGLEEDARVLAYLREKGCPETLMTNRKETACRR